MASVHFVTLEPRMNTVCIYVDTSKEVGDVDHLKVFATPELADAWFKENDPEGVAFEYEIIEAGSGEGSRTPDITVTAPPSWAARLMLA
jgi:hypothetical protein